MNSDNTAFAFAPHAWRARLSPYTRTGTIGHVRNLACIMPRMDDEVVLEYRM